MSLTYIDNTRLNIVRWMDGKTCCMKMALSYSITSGIILHALHGRTCTLKLHVHLSHTMLLHSLHLSISFTLREKEICPT